MFTGIVQCTGIIKGVRRSAGGFRIEIEPREEINALRIGDSIAVDGVCLTVAEKKDGIVLDVAPETLKRSTLKYIRTGDAVNLELPLTPQSPLGGHIVQGHVDCVGKIVSKRKEGDGERITIELPAEYSKFVVEKGSIAIDGMSLTVAKKLRNRIEIAIIPHTLKNTNISLKRAGSYVNIEIDIIARYIYNFLRERNIK